jgi:hypothetical protein
MRPKCWPFNGRPSRRNGSCQRLSIGGAVEHGPLHGNIPNPRRYENTRAGLWPGIFLASPNIAKRTLPLVGSWPTRQLCLCDFNIAYDGTSAASQQFPGENRREQVAGPQKFRRLIMGHDGRSNRIFSVR